MNANTDRLVSGQRIQLPGKTKAVAADAVTPRASGVDLYVTDEAAPVLGALRDTLNELHARGQLP